MRKHLFIVVSIIFIAAIVFTNTSQAGWLSKRSSLEVKFGVWNIVRAGNEYSSSGASSSAKANGFVGGLSYSYWWAEDFSFVASVGILSAEASTSTTVSTFEQRASTVVPLLIGVNYYFPESTLDSDLRPYVSGSIGSFMGFEARNDKFGQRAHSESAIGLRLGAGVDFQISRRFKLGIGLGYNFSTDFAEVIGTRKNYSGPDFQIGLGLLFGELP